MSDSIVGFVQALTRMLAHPTLGRAARLGLKLLSHANCNSFSSSAEGGERAVEATERLRAAPPGERVEGLRETIDLLSASDARVRQFTVQNENGIVTIWRETPTESIAGIVAIDVDCEKDPAVVIERDPYVGRVAVAELKRINALADGVLTFASVRQLGGGSWLFTTSQTWRETNSGMLFSGIIVGLGRVLYAPADEIRGEIVNTRQLEANDARNLLPLAKSDFYRANTIVGLGYPAVAPVLGDLLKWLQDYNWPIANVIGQFLASIGAPLAPHIRDVFASNDHTWKMWVICCVVQKNAELFDIFKGDLQRMATNPTAAERLEDLDEAARDVLAAGPSPPSGEDPRVCPRQPFAPWRLEAAN